MTLIDWSIVAGLVIVITTMAIITSRYTRSVADFLAASRLARRYLLTMAQNMSGTAAIQVVAGFEMFYRAGFAGQWWGFGSMPIGLVLGLSGWCFYRYRETRVLTIGQLFEVRYSKNFRIFMGIMCWISGIINFGIFPAVGSRFFIYFCGMPQTFMLLGIQFSTFAVVMFILIVIALFFTLIGGQIAVIVTDFLQSTFWNIAMIIILAFLFMKFDWSVVAETISSADEGKSMINPFDTQKTEGFNFWYFMIMGYFISLYGAGGLNSQGGSAYHSSSKSAHERRMAGIIGGLRSYGASLMVMMLAISVFVLMNLCLMGGAISMQSISMEFGDEEKLPTFTALAGTLLGIPTLLAPIIGGWIVDMFGFIPLFVTGLVLSCAGFAVLQFWVVDPRISRL